MEDKNPEKRRFINAIYYPVLLILILWLIKGIEWIGNLSLGNWGIFPREIKGLAGIIISPLLHADFFHLINNSIPLLILTSVLNYFYKPVALSIFLLIWFVTGMCVWIGGREAYHIGASGLIYGMASFLFFSGVFRKNIKLLAISLLIIFLYGSMVWGIFPFFPDISWESHLFGFIAGLTFASIYSKESVPSETVEIIEDPDDSFPYWEIDEKDNNTKIN